MSDRDTALLSEQPLLKGLWLALAVTSPLFAVEFFRYNSAEYLLHVTIPSVILAVILVVGATGFLRQAVSQKRLFPEGVIGSLKKERGSLLLLLVFVVWHFIGWGRSTNPVLGRREFIKMLFDGMVVLGILALFPRDVKFLERYWRLAVGAMALLSAGLFLRYLFVFHSTFMGSNPFEWTNSAKNQFVWHLMPALVFSLFYFCRTGRRAVEFLPLLILSTAWIYVSSRGAWVSVGFGLACLALWAGMKKSAPFLLCLGGAAALGILVLELFGPAGLDFHSRILWFVDPASTPQLQTRRNRFELIQTGWNCFQRSPWVGIGLGSTSSCFLETRATQMATHVDYLTVLSDLGVVGLGMFLSILGSIGAKILRLSRGEAASLGWISQGGWVSYLALLVSMLFINVYTTPFFWILCGLVWLTAISREKGAYA